MLDSDRVMSVEFKRLGIDTVNVENRIRADVRKSNKQAEIAVILLDRPGVNPEDLVDVAADSLLRYNTKLVKVILMRQDGSIAAELTNGSSTVLEKDE